MPKTGPWPFVGQDFEGGDEDVVAGGAGAGEEGRGAGAGRQQEGFTAGVLEDVGERALRLRHDGVGALEEEAAAVV